MLANSLISSTNILIVQHVNEGSLGSYLCTSSCSNGSATIYVRNLTAKNLSESIQLQFILISS